ncbi:MAG: RagB/SusD family nutrient uptake outer membrane protein [Duncaniella sp.]|nr:RagB/SusD family nutrient uptake outer membrane protein [Duncaniella sp.]MDE5961525.1 RagB/SusD family nutrient uptake outer membrane protein [Duncaniella sp.]
MKKIYGIIAMLMLFVSCDNKLDIVPKGKTTLDNIEDLETLLEQRWMLSSTAYYETMCGNAYPELWQTPASILADRTTTEYAALAGDESVDRAELANDDFTYETAYQYINYMNVILSKADGVSGDGERKKRVKAEARIMRAWLHFLMVNMYAGQYDDATAAQLGGVAYVDNTDVQVQKTKMTVKDVYDRILEDCGDDVIADLTQSAVNNPFRIGADFGNGVRAMVLMQMKRYDEALGYARQAVKFNSVIEDRLKALDEGAWTVPYTSSNNYFLCYHNNSNIGEWGGVVCTPDFAAGIDPNDVLMVLGQYTQDGWGDPMGYGPEGSYMCGSWDVHYNSYGLRTENMYYTIAECMIRAGQYREGLRFVDEVRDRRIYGDNPHYFDRTDITTEAQAMEILQCNKRQEMFTTIFNYLDRKRWNTEDAYRKTVIHDCGTDGIFTVSPDSPLWITPFPKTATLYNTSLTQNY